MGPGFLERALHRLISLLQFALLACLLICAGYQSHYIFFKALYFRIREIGVHGNQALSQREIVRLSGLELGDLFFKYNYAKVKERILSNPRVEDARVVVKSPNAIEIQIKERSPSFRLVNGRESYEVDHFGRILGTQQTVKRLPTVSGANPQKGAGGLQLESTQKALLALWVPILEKSPLKDYASINISSPYRVEVRWKDWLVYLADPTLFDRNVELMARALQEATDRAKVVNVIDLRFSNLVLKLSDASAAPAGDPPADGEDDGSPRPAASPEAREGVAAR
ncbi:MAG: FtsQ-type POTRA domain-containing protein [Candidatus Riflebacteria bacterium]|nr:FtsQ-type POTRA domain-containing protein [Candidatus Riflebacteria bacterium]